MLLTYPFKFLITVDSEVGTEINHIVRIENNTFKNTLTTKRVFDFQSAGIGLS